MDINQLILPEGDRTSVAIPPVEAWPATIAANRALAKDAPLGPVTVADLAASARARAVLDAAGYTRALGLSVPSPLSLGGAVVATGHQPYPFHPGVAVKGALVARLAQRVGGIPLFISVDSDDFRHDRLPLPREREGRLVREEVPFLPRGNAPLYERGESEPWETTVARVEAIRDRLASRPRFAALIPPVEAFVERLRRLDPPDDPTPAARAILLRRAWEADVAPPLLELPVSRLATHDTFLHFAAHLIEEIERFAPIYNGELARYRRERKLRYPVNPFPDLKGDAERRETPFWLLTGAGRSPLFVDAAGRLYPGADGETAGDLADLRDGKLAIRPKAIPLSIYLRLFVSDFFLHGVGGAKYDTLTDPVIARFYGVTPPEYGCVTATLHAPMEAPADPALPLADAERGLRDIDQRPEAMAPLSDDPAAFAPLAEEKQGLVALIASPDADKKALGQRIGQLNREMAALLIGHRKGLDEEIARLKDVADEQAVGVYRTYPYFLYDPATVARLFD